MYCTHHISGRVNCVKGYQGSQLYHSKLHKDSVWQSGVKWKSTGATKWLHCTEWRPNRVRCGGTAVLCCPCVGHLGWEACRLQSLVLGLFVHCHSKMKENSSLLSAPSAKCNQKMLKLTAQTFFILRSRLPINELWSDVLHTTKFQ